MPAFRIARGMNLAERRRFDVLIELAHSHLRAGSTADIANRRDLQLDHLSRLLAGLLRTGRMRSRHRPTGGAIRIRPNDAAVASSVIPSPAVGSGPPPMSDRVVGTGNRAVERATRNRGSADLARRERRSTATLDGSI